MGYTTEFNGRFEFDKPLEPELADYINRFSEARHVTRDVEAYKKSNPDWESKCFEGDPGEEGEYIADDAEFDGRDKDGLSLAGYNDPPGSCPGLWCQWIVEDNRYLRWNGAEKFYKYEKWLVYLINNFFAPKGYSLHGAIAYYGEDEEDRGVIFVDGSDVRVEPHADPRASGVDMEA